MTGFKTAMIIMFKEPKETMPKELKEDMMMFHQIENTSEDTGVMKKNKVELCVFAGSLLAMLLVNLKLVNFSAIYLILISAVIGLILYGIRKIRKGGKGE